jgi:hypothetical protein
MHGPSCITRETCQGACCTENIDVPQALVKYYCKYGWASSSDFFRGGIFAFQIQVSSITHRCIFFDLQLNGCRLHQTHLKPPQCALYPLKHTETSAICRMNYSVTIDSSKEEELHSLFKQYHHCCAGEWHNRLSHLRFNWDFKRKFPLQLEKVRPSRLLGVQVHKDTCEPLITDNFSWSALSFCDQIQCVHVTQAYFSCEKICPRMAQLMTQVLRHQIMQFNALYGKMEYYTIEQLSQYILE